MKRTAAAADRRALEFPTRRRLLHKILPTLPAINSYERWLRGELGAAALSRPDKFLSAVCRTFLPQAAVPVKKSKGLLPSMPVSLDALKSWRLERTNVEG